MRIAIVSDIHGNRTAFEAVLADLRQTSPDLILHGGDLADGGSSPVEIVDRIRDLGWQGVVGNTDEMLFMPESLTSLRVNRPSCNRFWPRSRRWRRRPGSAGRRAARLAARPAAHSDSWSDGAGACQSRESWRAPAPEASDAELESVYGPLGQPIAVYGHIHRSYIRSVSGMTVANTGSVSLSYDGDRRAAYLLLDEFRAGNPARGVRRGPGAQGAFRLRSPPRRLGCEDARERLPPDAVSKAVLQFV